MTSEETSFHEAATIVENVKILETTKSERKPRLPKTKANEFVIWLKSSEFKDSKPKIIKEEYMKIKGIDLNLGFVRNMKRLIKLAEISESETESSDKEENKSN